MPKTMKKDRQKRSFWSKRRDSNPRSPVPETGAIPPSLRLEIFMCVRANRNLLMQKRHWQIAFCPYYVIIANSIRFVKCFGAKMFG